MARSFREAVVLALVAGVAWACVQVSEPEAPHVVIPEGESRCSTFCDCDAEAVTGRASRLTRLEIDEPDAFAQILNTMWEGDVRNNVLNVIFHINEAVQGTFAAPADDLSAIDFNPAGLARLRGTRVYVANRFTHAFEEYRRARTLDWSDAIHGVPDLVDFPHVRNLVEREVVILYYTLSAAWKWRDTFAVGASLQWDKVTFSMTLPVTLRAGVRYIHVVDGREWFDLELDLGFEAWSMLDAFTMDAQGLVTEVLGNRIEPGVIRIPRNWRDTYSVRLGGDVNLWQWGGAARGGLTLRSGFLYESPAVKAAYAYLDVLSLHHFGPSASVSLNLGGFELSAAYTWILQVPLVVSEADARICQQVPGSPCAAPYNDVDNCDPRYYGQPAAAANAGTYLSEYHFVSAGAPYTFRPSRHAGKLYGVGIGSMATWIQSAPPRSSSRKSHRVMGMVTGSRGRVRALSGRA